MLQDPRKDTPRKPEPERALPAQQPETPAKPNFERTGPGSGAGSGNDLPSQSQTQRDTRTVEGSQALGGEETGPAIQSENPDA